MMSEILRFIGWWINKHRNELITLVKVVAFSTWVALQAVPISLFIWDRLDPMKEEAHLFVAVYIIAGLVSLILAAYQVYWLLDLIESCANTWKAYRQDYPARKRKQKDA